MHSQHPVDRLSSPSQRKGPILSAGDRQNVAVDLRCCYPVEFELALKHPVALLARAEVHVVVSDGALELERGVPAQEDVCAVRLHHLDMPRAPECGGR